MADPYTGSLTRRQAQRHTESIQTSKHLKRLENHAFGELEMSKSEIDASKFLISRTIGAAQALDITTDGQALSVNMVWNGNKPTDD
jgi:hypothetical protein